MRVALSFACAASCLIGFVTCFLPASARAEPAEVDARRVAAAAAEFDAGRRAYLASDFSEAASHFENAFRDVAAVTTLRNAIRSRKEAHDLARAATLSALAEALYPDDAPTRELATAVLAEAAGSFGEFRLACEPACAVALDGRSISLSESTRHPRVFVTPGTHLVTASWPTARSRAVELRVRAGEAVGISVRAPLGPAAVPPAAIPVARRKPLSPGWFYVGIGVTLALGAATAVSGIDTLENPGAARVRDECGAQGEACALYQEGRRSQLRTNLLLAGTVLAATATGAVGLLLTEWRGKKVTVGAGASGAHVGAHLAVSF